MNTQKYILILLTFILKASFPVCVLGQTGDMSLYLSVQNYTIDDYKASCQNWDIHVSEDGALYAANNSGLLEFDGNTWHLFATPGEEIIYKVREQNDTVFIKGEKQDGYWLYNAEKNLEYYPMKDTLPASLFRQEHHCVAFPVPEQVEEARPTVYVQTSSLNIVGTEYGVFFLDKKGNILRHLSMDNQLQDNFVHAICVQDETRIWLALDNGITQVDINPEISLLGTRSKVGKPIHVALQGTTVYIHTNFGYFKRALWTGEPFVPILPQEAEKFMNDKVVPSPFTPDEIFADLKPLTYFRQAEYIYPTYDNMYWLLLGNEAGLFKDEGQGTSLKCRLLFDNYHMHLTTRGPHFFTLNDSLYAVSTMQGVVLVNLRKLITGTLQLTMPRFRRVTYQDREGLHYLRPDTSYIELPNRFQEVDFYVGTTVFTPNHQISYLLEGVSTQWSEWQNTGKILFSQLPEGTYTLRVRKYVTRGAFPEITMTIKVLPAWYNSIWAYLAYIFLLFAGVWSYLKYNQRRLKQEEQAEKEQADQLEQHKQDVLRNKTLEDELQSKNNELMIQMSAVVRRNQAIQSFLTELESQKEQLGDRYPSKLYKRLHGLMEEALEDKEDWQLFEAYFKNAHQAFWERLQGKFPDLTSGDLRICCLLRMNLSTKEIASLLNISVRAVEIRRYRLRKKLELSAEMNLVDFLLRL